MSIRKPILTLFLATLLFSGIFSIQGFAGTVTNITRGGGPWSDIQSAVNAAQSGDILNLSGSFSGGATISLKNLKFTSADNAVVASTGQCFHIEYSTVTFESFTMQDTSNNSAIYMATNNDAVYLNGMTIKNCSGSSGQGSVITGTNNPITMNNCILQNNTVCIYLQAFTGGVLNATGCTFTGNSGYIVYNYYTTNFPQLNFTSCNFTNNTNGLIYSCATIANNCTFSGNNASVNVNLFRLGSFTGNNNTSFTSNVTTGSGMFGQLTVDITNCTFSSNTAEAGIFDGATVNANSCSFTNNYRSIFYSSGNNILNCLFKDNKTGSNQLITGSSPTLKNCIFDGNISTTSNSIGGNGGTIFQNCVVLNNASSVYLFNNTNYLYNTIVYNNSPSNAINGFNDYTNASYNCFYPPSALGGTGNIGLDPRFLSTTFGNGNYCKLSSLSPCIDPPGASTYVATDYAGLARPHGFTSDMGIHEYQGMSIRVTYPNTAPMFLYPPGVTDVQWEIAAGTPVGNSNIRFSTNNGATWSGVVASQASIVGINTASNVTLPLASGSLWVSVEAADSNGPRIDMNENPPYLSYTPDVPPVVSISSPEAGRVFRGGWNVPIKWTATDATGISSQNVYYSTNGTTWTTLASGLGASVTTSEWSNVPYIDSITCRISVEARDPANNVGRAVSGAFKILVSPEAVTDLAATPLSPTSARLTWTAPSDNDNSANVSSYTGYASTEPINASNYGALHQMSLSAFLPGTPAARGNPESIDISGLTSGAAYYFAIKSLDAAGTQALMSNLASTTDTYPPTVTVTDPNTAVILTGGTTHNILWTASDPSGIASDGITIRLSTDSGNTWSPVQSGLSNSGTYAWTVPPLKTLYVCRISVEAADTIGNIASDMSDDSFLISTEGSVPTLESIRINGKVILPGDIISQNGMLYLKIKDATGINSVSMYIDGSTTPVVFTCSGVVTPEEIWMAPYSIPATETGSHSLTFDITNDYGTFTTTEAVMVYTGAVQMIGKSYNFPNPFSPLSGDPALSQTNIQYQLSGDTNITIVIYDLTGQHIYSKTYRSGSQGGRAGYNTITWNGSSVLKKVAGNGMYLYKIIARDRAIGSGRLVIKDNKPED